MNSIVQELKRDYEAVWYFVSDQADRVVGEAIARVGALFPGYAP